MGKICIGVIMNIAASLFIGLGVMFVVISQLNHETCEFHGYPPLPLWILGTGISFIIIGVSYVVTFVLSIIVIPESIGYSNEGYTERVHWSISLHSGIVWSFLLAWMIIGCVSLWRDGGNCNNPNSQIWNTGMAGVIILIVAFGFLLTAALGAACGNCIASDDGYD